MPSPPADAARPAKRHGAPRNWRETFLAALAETSNVTAAAAAGSISLSCAYRTRRKDRDFAAAWLTALAEGYDRLELELLARLREGEQREPAEPPARRYDNATALRLLLAHRDSRARQPAQSVRASAAEVRAALEENLARLRERVLNREAAERADHAG